MRVRSALVCRRESEERNTPAPRLILNCSSRRVSGSNKTERDSSETGFNCSGKFAAISAAILALKTSPSNNELDAKRFAPWTPEQAVSPHA